MNRKVKTFIGALCLAMLCMSAYAQIPPGCRLDDQKGKVVESTIRLAMQAYTSLGKTLPFENIVTNPNIPASDKKFLTVFVVSDASTSAVGQDGCIIKSPALVGVEELDEFSVSGGCIAIASDNPEIRCSSGAVQTFGKQGDRPSLQNPALLYVIAHELGHILQRRPGEYAGRVEPIDLRQSVNAKLEVLQESCEPGLVKAEEDADQMAVQVLAKLLPYSPYREPLFSEQGSVLWGMDQLNLAANTWRTDALEREFISQKSPHKSFVPIEFPTPAAKVKANAKRFVCDVLTKKTGIIYYPGRAATHPPLEVRMQRVAESLRPIAANLPKAGAQQEYKPIAILQEQLGDIFAVIYRETGVYLQAVQSAICTKANSDHPTEGCLGKK